MTTRKPKRLEYSDDLHLGLDGRNVFLTLSHNYQSAEDVRRKTGLGRTRFELALIDIQRCKIRLERRWPMDKIRISLNQEAVKVCECQHCKGAGKRLPIFNFPHSIVKKKITEDNGKVVVERIPTDARVKYCLDCCRSNHTATIQVGLYG